MDIKILDSVNDKKKWFEVFQLKKNLFFDIFYHPDYLNLFLKNKLSEGKLFYVRDEEKIWLNCFIKNKIQNYENVFQQDIYENESPYGYSGPLSNSNDVKFLHKAQQIFFNWCQQEKIIVDFVRFHPFVENTKFFSQLDEIYFERKNRFIDLRNFNSDITFFNPKVRNKIRKILKVNIDIDERINEENYDLFVQNYLKFIKNIKANKFYSFSEDFFKKFFFFIKTNGFLITIKKNKKFLGSSIFLFSGKLTHYFLTVIAEKNNISGINNIILYHFFNLAKKKGYQSCNLGGGLSSENDSLMDFKKSMSDKENDFYIGYKIYDKIAYEKIINNYKTNHPEAYKKNLKKILCYNFFDE